MIEVHNLCLEREGRKLLEKVSFRAPNGHLYGICTDETTSKYMSAILSGVCEPDSGTVRLNGFDLKKDPIKAKSIIGYLPCPLPMDSDMTAFEFLHFLAEFQPISAEKAFTRVQGALTAAELDDRRNSEISTLLKSERSRLALASLMVTGATVLVMDNPTKGLKDSAKKWSEELMGQIAEGKTAFLFSPDRENLQSLCDVVWVLENGVLTEALETPVDEEPTEETEEGEE